MSRQHGTRSSYVMGCHCALCTAANTAYWREYHRARGRRPRAEVMAEQLAPCGTRGAYERGCKCGECRAAYSQYQREMYQRRKTKRQAEQKQEEGIVS